MAGLERVMVRCLGMIWVISAVIGCGVAPDRETSRLVAGVSFKTIDQSRVLEVADPQTAIVLYGDERTGKSRLYYRGHWTDMPLGADHSALTSSNALMLPLKAEIQVAVARARGQYNSISGRNEAVGIWSGNECDGCDGVFARQQISALKTISERPESAYRCPGQLVHFRKLSETDCNSDCSQPCQPLASSP